ncbi:hypothetical protein [Phyllobacterium lublinensis]|uniref:hypothetical protein n=1 Tax=Phyllobacterium lublinensis TaxID=2875708 RepID=UPI001CCA56F2|nr:hypothetical protein [Phyllobacterium sp. 2063]MBZ9653670.1 hypothetical protein [Phyllobacterium sp. 2063]
MGTDEPGTTELRIELSNLRDDLAVIESSYFFIRRTPSNLEAVKAIKARIAEIETILEWE